MSKSNQSEGVIEINSGAAIKRFIDAGKHQRVWHREPRLADPQ